MNTKTVIIALILSLLSAKYAYCDEVYTYLYVQCKPSDKTMIVIPKPELNNRRSLKDHGPLIEDRGKDREFIVSYLIKEAGVCVLDKNLRIGITAWFEPAKPTGQCSASPANHLFLEINGKRVLEAEVEPWCGGLLLKSLTVSTSGIEVCTYEEPSYKCDWVPDNPEPRSHCELKKLPNTALEQTP